MLLSYLDNKGSSRNGWMMINFNKTTWRYATLLEIELYDLHGRPVNVNLVSNVKEIINMDYLTLLFKKHNLI